MKNNKKGFTIVELVIVMAVIAILAAVLVPKFTGIIQRAYVSADTQVVRLINEAVAIDAAEKGITKHSSMYDAGEAAKINGIDINKWVNKSEYTLAWEASSGKFVLLDVDSNTVIYPPDSMTDETYTVTGNENGYFIRTTYDDKIKSGELKYSVYAIGNDWPSEVEVHYSFDAGEVAFTKVKYLGKENGESQAVTIVTNSYNTRLIVNGSSSDIVDHYGKVERALNLSNCTYNEHGDVGYAPGLYDVKGNRLYELTLENCGEDCSHLLDNIVKTKNCSLSVIAICSTTAYNWYYDNKIITKVILPEGVTTTNGVFRASGSIEEIVLPTTLVDIGKDEFEGIYGLKYVEILETVKTIGYNAFRSCWNLLKITIPENVESVGNEAFGCCYNLRDIVIEGKTVFDASFRHCYYLKNVTLKEGVEVIYNGMFQDCSITSYAINHYRMVNGKMAGYYADGSVGCVKYTDGFSEVVIPSTVKEIQANAFSQCHLEKVTFAGNSQLETLGQNAFQHLPIAYRDKNNIVYYDFKGLQEIKLNGDNFVAESNAIYFKENGVKTAVVMYFGNDAAFTIPSTVTAIRPYAFTNALAGLTIVMSNTVTEVNSTAFNYYGGLSLIYNDTLSNFKTKLSNYASWISSFSNVKFTDAEGTPVELELATGRNRKEPY